MRLYLDNCAFNRPFDDQSHIRIRLESEAKLYVQEKIKNGDIEENDQLVARARKFVLSGIHSKDALHIASAIEGKADYFLTTDDKLLKKLSLTTEIKAVNPVDIVEVIDEHR